MKRILYTGMSFGLAMAISASAFTLNGKVTDEKGAAVSGASVALVQKGLQTKTDASGAFTFHQDDPVTPGDSLGQGEPCVAGTPGCEGGSEAIALQRSSLGYLSVNGGVLSFSQGSSAPVQVQIFDMVGNRLLSETLYGSGTVDMNASVRAKGVYFARVSVGSAQQTFKFTADGSFNAAFGKTNSAKALLKVGDSDNLQVVADGFDTLTVKLNNLDTTLALTLKKKTPPQPQYEYGWGLKNDPVPTRGCGKDTKLDYKYRGDKPYIEFKWSKGTRTVRIDIPKSYDKNKPYKLIFGMQCMGGWAGGVQDEGYYGLKQFDKDESVIFVAPEGNGNQAPWAQDDYLLFDELLAMLEGNFCIDSSRVFSTGFSYGSMFSNGLSWNHQDVLRAVAVYETAERNIWLPQRQNKGIGWMGVLGLDDNLCTPEMGRAARDIILTLNSEGGKAKNERAEEAQRNAAHKCYDYTTVEERFPVRWCTQSGGHIWDHKDPGQQQSWVPQTTWDFFSKF
ncbi:MAG: T9SS type A sorting domain-containing protein [Fibrobacter sp.]|nr:T9SS type A sorting domain-containing protein [Fibrobacter sp.]